MVTANRTTGRAIRRARDGDPPRGPSGANIDPIRLGRAVAYSGYTVLICRDDGGIGADEEGLWDLDTRVLSHYDLRLDGSRPRPIASCVADAATWAATLIQPRRGRADGPHLPQDAWEVRIDRRLGCGMTERIEVTNRSMAPASVELTLELGADFIDRLEPRDHDAERRIASAWVPDRRVLRFDAIARYDGREDRRGLAVAFSEAPTAVAEPADRAKPTRLISFAIDLPGGGRWTFELTYATYANGTWRQPAEASDRPAIAEAWRQMRTHVRTEEALVGPAVERAAEDLQELRQWELSADLRPDAWIVNAGVPRFTGFFGRDCLTAGWQAAMLGPEPVRGAIEIAAATQGRRFVPRTEEEPGRMIHEMRSGPLSTLGVVPNGGYYGSQTTGSMFLLALSEAWHWTGDIDLLRRHREAAIRAIDWAETLADRDGDGFMEYHEHAPGGLKNQGWKDSDEAIRYPDGALVPNPIATVEEQAFHYLALQRMAEILIALGDEADSGDRDRADALLQRAAALRTAWDATFWMPHEGFYAMALDGDHRPVATIGSNPGHALGAGIVPPERAVAVADRLLARDLYSGWGVRTLSTEHPSYNPLGYHLGAVWPVENATIALGFKRYGLDDHLDQLLEGLFAAIAHCRDLRLPEALTGHDRDEFPHPLPYPRSQSPQAWSASATIQLLQMMLGIYPFAPAHVLGLVRPRLPVWLPSVTIEGLRVGEATVTLRFERDADGAAHHSVVAQEGPLWVLEVPPPDAVSGDDGMLPKLVAWAVDHAPGRMATALRIAMGDNGPIHDNDFGEGERP
ncbi:MAG TPA: glycogen debranching N-terminal domain-containing protein [Candidatus Limnocylindrales bacterium]|nr:glycogen debranching N-terminal domain-containing protein [Candidatus Limnocylindrales bacterium]